MYNVDASKFIRAYVGRAREVDRERDKGTEKIVCVCGECMWINTFWTFIKARYSVKTKRKLEDFHFISFLISAPTLYYIKINCCRSFLSHSSSSFFGEAWDDSFHFVIELLCTYSLEASNVCLLLLVSLLLFYLPLRCSARLGLAWLGFFSSFIYLFILVWDLAVNL